MDKEDLTIGKTIYHKENLKADRKILGLGDYSYFFVNANGIENNFPYDQLTNWTSKGENNGNCKK